VDGEKIKISTSWCKISKKDSATCTKNMSETNFSKVMFLIMLDGTLSNIKDISLMVIWIWRARKRA
jgi:hypothetical protein